MPKEKNYNPVQAQRKADKAKAIRKGKAEVQQQRNQRLARKNSDRIQKQIDELTALIVHGGKLSRHEEQLLESLQREVKAVRRARESVGESAPEPTREGGPSQKALGKRRRSFTYPSSEDEEEIPEDVRNIPMPRDTPPPIPQVIEAYYAPRRAAGEKRAKQAPAVESKTVYEAKPVMRDLRQEAVQAFVPAAVQMNRGRAKGRGGLLESEEADRLEREGYLGGGEGSAGTSGGGWQRAMVADAVDED